MTVLISLGPCDRSGLVSADTTICASDQTRKTNAKAIREFAQLGLIGPTVLDLTHNTGRFWHEWQPEVLVRMDIDPTMPIDIQADLRMAPFRTSSFDTVVLDPPYKMNGAGGSCQEDATYGVADRWTRRDGLYSVGLAEALRVCKRKGTIIVKFQDQIAGGKIVQQSVWVHEAMAGAADLIGQLLVVTSRPQPSDREQRTPRNNFSTMQAWRTR